MSTAIMSPEHTAALQRARQANARPRPISVPEIKLCQNKMDGVMPGEYYTKEYDSVAEKSIIKNIGATPQVTILCRLYSYSYYDDTDKELKAWSNELAGFSNTDQAYLFVKKDGKTFIEFQGFYPDLKKHITSNYMFKKGARVESLMTFRNVLYVLYKNKAYRMFVSNASTAGISETGSPDFKAPQPLSLLDFCNTVSHSDENAFHGHYCLLGTIKMTPPNKPAYHLMTFKEDGHVADLVDSTDKYMQLLTNLEQLQRNNIERMQILTLEQETKEVFEVIDS